MQDEISRRGLSKVQRFILPGLVVLAMVFGLRAAELLAEAGQATQAQQEEPTRASLKSGEVLRIAQALAKRADEKQKARLIKTILDVHCTPEALHDETIQSVMNYRQALKVLGHPDPAIVNLTWIAAKPAEAEHVDPKDIEERLKRMWYSDRGTLDQYAYRIHRGVRTALIQKASAKDKPGFADWLHIGSEYPLRNGASDILPPVGREAFITALCEDKFGRIWVGTEENGLWVYQPNAEAADQWHHMTRISTGGQPEEHGPVLTTGTPNENALGDDYIYALACDRLGRIWVGHLNHGVSVYDGRNIEPDLKGHYRGWRNYDVLSGPLGERVFDIAVTPEEAPKAVAGDVWIATDSGLSRYSLSEKKWSYITRAEGLTSDQLMCVTVDQAGKLYVGTQAHGLCIASPDKEGNYKEWKSVRAQEYKHRIPLSPVGKGLPTDLINDMVVGRDGIYVATTTGLAWSKDAGKTWQFTRGQDWDEKVEGLYQGPEQADWGDTREGDLWLKEDYVTKLLITHERTLLAGHRMEDYAAMSLLPDFARDGHGPLANYKLIQSEVKAAEHWKEPYPLDYIQAVVQLKNGDILLGSYRSGVVKLEYVGNRHSRYAKDDIPRITPIIRTLFWPARASKPSLETLHSYVQRTAEEYITAKLTHEQVIQALGSDWTTQGDWLGRYGREYAILCGAGSPTDHIAAYDKSYSIRKGIGANHRVGDGIRHWVHAKEWDDRRVLYNPLVGYRRQSSWDDHGETYPMSHNGPHIVIDCMCHNSSPMIISLYFFNKDGTTKSNRFRDFLVVIESESSENRAKISSQIASQRVTNFRGGVYIRFLVHEVKKFKITIYSDNSFNGIVSGVFIDSAKYPSDHEIDQPLGAMGTKSFGPPRLSDIVFQGATLEHGETKDKFAIMMKSDLTNMHIIDGSLWNSHFRILSLRAFHDAGTELEALNQSLRWRSHFWNLADRKAFENAMSQGFQSFEALNKNSR